MRRFLIFLMFAVTMIFLSFLLGKVLFCLAYVLRFITDLR